MAKIHRLYNPPPGVWPSPPPPPGSNVWPEGGYPPCPPSFPPCPPPGCGSSIAKAESCYNQTQQLNSFLTQVVGDLLTSNPSLIADALEANPDVLAEIIASSPVSGPILGVTNGSVAQPGQVGEVAGLAATGSTPAATPPAPTVINLSVGVLQPGDWMLFGFVNLDESAAATGTYIFAQLLNGGTNLAAISFGYAPPGEGTIGFNAGLPAAHLSVAVPTLLTGLIQVAGQAAAVPINWQFGVFAQRIR